jgi:Flp pilus assembly protein TadD
MKRVIAIAAMLFIALTAARTGAQVGAMVRGTVTDEKGQPMPDVKVEIKFQGTRDEKPRTFTQTTNKRGYFTRVGLPDGPYKITFSKDGYEPTTITTNISLGGLSDLGTVPMRARKDAAPEDRPAAGAPGPAAAPPGAPGAAPVDVAALSQEQEEFKQTFKQAIEAGKAGRLDEAEGLYKQILAKAPNLAVAHYNLGFVYRQKKDWASAETEYQKAIELQPDSSAGYVALAGVYQGQEQTDRAIKVLADVASRFEHDAEFQYGLGIVLFDSGKADNAAAAFQKVTTINAANPEPLYYLGVIAVQKNRTQEALGYLEQYVAASGQNPRNLQTAQGLLKALQRRS